MARTTLPIPHGTPRGATAHRRRGEKACAECLAAQAADSKERKASAHGRGGNFGARHDDPRKKDLPRPSWGWQDDAACRGLPLELFFGPEGERRADRLKREAEAAEVCHACPVRTDCLDYAVSRPEKYGTWGGLNEDERASERRRRMRRAAS